MVFTILTCADILGHKINVEIPYASPPTLSEVRQRSDQVFYEEATALARQGRLTTAASELLSTTTAAPGFDGRGVYQDSGLLSLGRIQIYDDALLRWVDLVSPSQLHEYDQIYIFPKHRAHLSQVKDLPPPKPTGAALQRSQVGDLHYSGVLGQSSASVANSNNLNNTARSASASPSRHVLPPNPSSAVHRGGNELSPSRYQNNNNNGSRSVGAAAGVASQRPVGYDVGVEELDRRQRAVFQVGDRNGNSYLSVDDFRSLFARTKVLFNDVTVTELFAMHAHNGRFMTFAEWQLFARNFPQLFAAVYRRLMDTQAETDMSNELELGAKRLLSLRDEAEELQKRLDAARKEIAAQEARSKEVAARLADARNGRVPVEEEEQVVLEKEVRIRFQREMLMREENELKEASKRLDERTANNATRGDVRRF